MSIHTQVTADGTYTLGLYDVNLYRLQGYDVSIASYQSADATSGHITITGFHGIGSEIEGSFDFDGQLLSGAPVYGPTAKFRSGHFRAVVKETVFTL